MNSKKIVALFISVILFTVSYAQNSEKKNKNWPVLKGAYLGMKPPGETPEIFAPGIISTRFHEHSYAVFSPDGTEVYWTSLFIDNKYDFPTGLLFMKLKKRWSQPEYALINTKNDSGAPCFSFDGKKLYFSDGKRNSDIWFVNKTTNGWSKAKKIPGSVNTSKLERQGSVTRNGTLYYLGFLKGVRSNYGIYRSEFKDGKFQKPEVLPEQINSKSHDWTPFISPDEDFILWSSVRDGGFGSGDLYISFRSEKGEWSKAINLGPKINKNNNERFPGISPDGKYLFFVSDQIDKELMNKKKLSFKEAVKHFNLPGNGMSDIYWVSTKIIDELRPDKFKKSE